ncbi:MAG: DNA repair exonuclease [Eubacterium sp.]|nr:DNA repair exonuclease [Eubacterium sp.]
MKVSFIHTGDLHIGRQFHFARMGDVYGRNRRMDLWESFERILNTAEKNHIDLLLISGNLFDKDEMDLLDIERAAERFSRLTRTHVVICAGNHDYYSSLSIYGLVEWPDNVTLFKTGRLESVYFPDINTEVYSLSWTKRTYASMPFSPDFEVNPEHNNILMLHGDACNMNSEYMPIPVERLDQFDYMALGHLHNHFYINAQTAYCGTPEPLGFDEAGDHGVVVGQLEDHRCQSQFVPIQKRRFFEESFEITPAMGEKQIEALLLERVPEEQRKHNYHRFILKGYRDPAVSLEKIKSALYPAFYYLEIDDSGLVLDLDVELLLKENRGNIVGKFIQEMRLEGDDALAERALEYGLEGILREKVVL